MSKEFIVVDTLVYHGMPKPAKHLHEGENILFGGKVWIVADANFKDEAKYPNDLEINLQMIQEHADSDKQILRQTVIVDRDFEIQPLIVSVLPARSKEPVEDAQAAQG
jgi:hypothetical protein